MVMHKSLVSLDSREATIRSVLTQRVIAEIVGPCARLELLIYVPLSVHISSLYTILTPLYISSLLVDVLFIMSRSLHTPVHIETQSISRAIT